MSVKTTVHRDYTVALIVVHMCLFRQELAPATLELQETFALRRILLKHGQRTEVDSQAGRLLGQ